MSYTWLKRMECKDCDFKFEGYSGYQEHGKETHNIETMYCPKCKKFENIVTIDGVKTGKILCKECATPLVIVDAKDIYICPKCGEKSVVCTNNDSIYSERKIILY